MCAVRPGWSVLTVCENGYGKRTVVDEYRLTRRGGKGVINIKTTDRNGPVVAVRSVTDDDSLMMITAKGIMIRQELRELRAIGRATQGVRLMRVDDDDRVVAVAKIVTAEQEDEAADEAANERPPAAASEGETPEPPGDTE
jgi:DNA gyrase subunit A